MKATVVKGPKNPQYPYLAIANVNENLIVIFLAKDTAFVISSGGSSHKDNEHTTLGEGFFSHISGTVTLEF